MYVVYTFNVYKKYVRYQTMISNCQFWSLNSCNTQQFKPLNFCLFNLSLVFVYQQRPEIVHIVSAKGELRKPGCTHCLNYNSHWLHFFCVIVFGKAQVFFDYKNSSCFSSKDILNHHWHLPPKIILDLSSSRKKTMRNNIKENIWARKMIVLPS